MDEFLVHADSGAIIARTAQSTVPRVLVPQADLALYDPSLELLWFVYEDLLSVVDLRERAPTPVVIARDLPSIDRFGVIRGSEVASIAEPCDSSFATLTWDETSTIEAFSTPHDGSRIDDGGWLKAHLDRPVRTTGEERPFTEKRVRLPAKVTDCEDPSACGTSVPFGARPAELVRVWDGPGGDCWMRACVLRDPETGLFASPPKAEAWGPVTKAKPGPCGLYYFDAAQRSFLVDNFFCSADGECTDLVGLALGWTVPGDVVGEPGNYHQQ